jgi:hypothetical protein
VSAGAVIFMACAWAFVLGLTFWSFARLMTADPEHEAAPPPGTSL